MRRARYAIGIVIAADSMYLNVRLGSADAVEQRRHHEADRAQHGDRAQDAHAPRSPGHSGNSTASTSSCSDEHDAEYDITVIRFSFVNDDELRDQALAVVPVVSGVIWAPVATARRTTLPTTWDTSV